MPLHFSSKDFEILDLDPPNNPTSHYGACHFDYNLALNTFLPFRPILHFGPFLGVYQSLAFTLKGPCTRFEVEHMLNK